MSTEIFNMLNALATKLNTTIEHLWEMLVYQGYVEGVADLTFSGIMLVPALVFGLLFYRCTKKIVKDEVPYGQDGPYAGGAVLGGFFSVMSIFGVVMNLLQGIKLLMNPEYYAFTTIKTLLAS